VNPGALRAPGISGELSFDIERRIVAIRPPVGDNGLEDLPLSKPEWGTKRVCPSCGAKYYDMRRSPIVCPSCGAGFDPDAVLRSRRSKPAPSPKEVEPVKAPKPAVAGKDDDDLEAVEAGPGFDDDLATDEDDEEEALIEDPSELDDDDMSDVVIDDDDSRDG